MPSKHPFTNKIYKEAQRQIKKKLQERIDVGKIQLGRLMAPDVRDREIGRLADAWADKSMRHACDELRKSGNTKPLERAGVEPDIIKKLVELYNQ